MDTFVAACVNDFGGGDGDAMMVTTDEDDLFLGVDEESGELFFSWTADNETTTIVVGDGDSAVLPSPPLIKGDTTTKTQEDLSRGRGGYVEQISRPKNTKPQTKVYNFKDLFSPSRMTAAPSNNDRGRVRMDTTDMEPPHQDDPRVIQAVPEEQAPERKSRISWTKDEQKLFLMGVMVFDEEWKNIKKHFVTTKSSTQIGSHVQKFKKRKKQTYRKKRTINDVRVDDITRQDVERLAPKKWRPAVLAAMDGHFNGKTSLVQQYPNASLQENASGCSTQTRRRPFIPAVQETVTNPLALIAQPAPSIAFASYNVCPTPLQPASSFVAYADGRQTPPVQPSPCPHLGAAYLGYPSSTYYPANYQPLSLPQLDTTPWPGTYYSTPLPRRSYTDLAPTQVGHSQNHPWKNP